MDHATLVALVQLANNAKSYGLYDLANIATAVLVDEFLQQCKRAFFGEEENFFLIACWETGDRAGSLVEEAFYDLLVIEVVSSGTVCIPVPMINSMTAVTILKGMPPEMVEARGEHGGRRLSVPSAQTEMLLWDNLKRVVPKRVAVTAVNNVLDKEDGNGEPFSERLLALIDERILTFPHRPLHEAGMCSGCGPFEDPPPASVEVWTLFKGAEMWWPFCSACAEMYDGWAEVTPA